MQRPADRIIRFLLAIIWLIGAVNCTAVAAAPPRAPTHLTVDDVDDALGTGPTPYFGWHVNDPDPDVTPGDTP
jgi:hypothetical protein